MTIGWSWRDTSVTNMRIENLCNVSGHEAPGVINYKTFTSVIFTRGVLLGILGGGVPPGSPNPDPISDQKCLFLHPFSDQTRPLRSIPVFRPGL